ncbi:MAG: lysophospholipase [Cyclobacteriaceae bacterium]
MVAETSNMLGSDGLELFYRYWIPEKPEKVFCIIHGHGEHGGRYEHIALHLTKMNVSTFAMDLRGHGLSKGKRGHAASYDLLMRDVEELIKTARETFNDLPIYLMGHSMGGNLVANFMINDTSKEISGFILSSPWLKLAFEPSKIKLKLGQIMTKIWPSYSENNGLEVNYLSKDPIEVKKYVDDPLVHGMISAGLFSAISEASDNALVKAGNIKTKGLVYHGSADQIIDHKTTQAFAASNELLEWHLLDGVFHEPHNDLEKDSVLTLISNWISENK